MSKGKRNRAEREATRLAHDYTQFSEGTWLGQIDGEHPVARELIRRYNAAAKDVRACPHLQQDLDQPRFWVDAVPELLACADCTPVLAAKEHERKDTRCLLCGEHVALRGVTVASAGVVMRCGVCAQCEVAGEVSPS